MDEDRAWRVYARSIGVRLGYPQCCSEYFFERMAAFQRCEPIPSMLGEAWHGTGFIPCEAHQAQIRATGMAAFVAEHIAPNRIHPYPFPEEGDLFDATRAHPRVLLRP